MNTYFRNQMFGSVLKQRLFDAYVTGAELADYLGVYPGTVYSWTSGRTFPRLEHLEEINDFLGLEFECFTDPRTFKILEDLHFEKGFTFKQISREHV